MRRSPAQLGRKTPKDEQKKINGATESRRHHHHQPRPRHCARACFSAVANAVVVTCLPEFRSSYPGDGERLNNNSDLTPTDALPLRLHVHLLLRISATALLLISSCSEKLPWWTSLGTCGPAMVFLMSPSHFYDTETKFTKGVIE